MDDPKFFERSKVDLRNGSFSTRTDSIVSRENKILKFKISTFCDLIYHVLLVFIIRLRKSNCFLKLDENKLINVWDFYREISLRTEMTSGTLSNIFFCLKNQVVTS